MPNHPFNTDAPRAARRLTARFGVISKMSKDKDLTKGIEHLDIA